MIAVLGLKRIVVLLGLLVVNALLAGTIFFFLSDQKTDKARELRQVRAEVADLRTDIERLKVDFDQLEIQQGDYEALRARGFFSDQGRRAAERALKSIQETIGLVSAVANIRPGVLTDHPEAARAGHQVLESTITVELEALDDVDVLKYVALIEQQFPGHVSVEYVEIERKAEVTGTVLRAIASGENPPLVEARVGLTWRTMIADANSAAVRSGGRL